MWFRRLFWYFSPPYEVKLAMMELIAFLKQQDTSLSCLEIVFRDTKALLKIAEKTVYSIRIDGMKPDHLALMLITNVIGHHLTSGRHHIYRGLLSIEGRDMLKLWNTAVYALRERGFYTDAKVEKDMKWIREQMKNVG